MDVNGDSSHSEWMLLCPVVTIYSSFVLFVSRAYHSHHAIVYSYHMTGKLFVESISTNISVIIEKDTKDLPEAQKRNEMIDRKDDTGVIWT